MVTVFKSNLLYYSIIMFSTYNILKRFFSFNQILQFGIGV